MTRLTNGTKTIEITLTTWTGNGYEPDWSADFFSVGSLPYNDELDAYVVDDVDYCVEQANDWASAIGDFRDDRDYLDDEAIDNRTVFVEEV